MHGPLRGVVGRLMRKDAPKARLVLSVDLIGQAVSVEVDAADVQAVLTSKSRKSAPSTSPSPFAIAPMAGMTDTAFRRLVKRHGGCGLVVTEMVSSEGLVRGIDRTLEYAEYTEEERPISIQIFGGDPDKMAAAAQIVEGMGADIVDVNMGCPVPKIAKHNAGCSLMREPAHAAAVIAAMTKAVKIPVTVKMRAGWNDDERNAPTLARMVRGRRRGGDRGPRPHRGAELQRVGRLGSRRADRRRSRRSRCSAAATASSRSRSIDRMRSGVEGVLVGRGVLRNPVDPRAGGGPRRGHGRARVVTLADRGHFLLEYIDLLMQERVDEAARDDARSLGREQAAGARLLVSRRASTTARTCAPRSTARLLDALRDTITEFFGVAVGRRLSPRLAYHFSASCILLDTWNAASRI